MELGCGCESNLPGIEVIYKDSTFDKYIVRMEPCITATTVCKKCRLELKKNKLLFKDQTQANKWLETIRED